MHKQTITREHQLGRERSLSLLKQYSDWQAVELHDTQVSINRNDLEWVSMDLTPVCGMPQESTAEPFFREVDTVEQLVEAYYQCCSAVQLEVGYLDAHVHSYANEFLNQIFDRAQQHLADQDARLIAQWVSDFDIYVAVKAVESLLNSEADLALLRAAAQQNWHVHFDHLAIRCGCSDRQHAEKLVKLLVSSHGYQAPAVESEVFYHFSDGWNAYYLFKILRNGLVLRLFIDQSEPSNPLQIIQHWNRVYGFTAHHLAMRATRISNHQHQEIPLSELTTAIKKQGVQVLAATGDYTHGLLEQVFTRPEQNDSLPKDLIEELKQVAPALVKVIRNGKLLELVSRREVPMKMAESYFDLLGINYDSTSQHHSCPYYDYFLPAQAAHVIRTSVQSLNHSASNRLDANVS